MRYSAIIIIPYALLAALLLCLALGTTEEAGAAAAKHAPQPEAPKPSAGQIFDRCQEQAQALAPNQQTAAEKQCRKAYAHTRLMTAQELWNAFYDDPLEAEERYVGKLIAVKGNVTRVGMSPMGYPELTLGLDSFGVKSVRCQFPKSAQPELTRLEPGRSVIVGGICKSFSHDTQVNLNSCELY